MNFTSNLCEIFIIYYLALVVAVAIFVGEEGVS
jgi:hypothetical protein